MIDVYKITHVASGRQYIGITTAGVATRWKRHQADARRGRTTALARAIRKYGPAAFQVEIVEQHESDEVACERERALIADLNTLSPLGFNLADGGRAQFRVSPETRARISKTQKGRSKTAEMRARLSAAKKGCPGRRLSQEERENLSRLNRGKKVSEATRRKLAAVQSGRKATELARAAMSAAALKRSAEERPAAVPRSDNTSGFLGVYFDTYSGRWKAQIFFDGKARHIGRFKTAQEANAARLSAERELLGILPQRAEVSL